MARPGKKPHVPTAEDRKTVQTLSGYGIPLEQIAADIGVSVDTLDRHYRAQLDEGVRKANSLVVQNLHRQATGNSPQAVTAAIWWTKSRMGWREKNDIDVTIKQSDPASLSDAELVAILRRGRAGAVAPQDDTEEPGGLVH